LTYWLRTPHASANLRLLLSADAAMALLSLFAACSAPRFFFFLLPGDGDEVALWLRLVC
jgi:hypothetical protein